LSSGNHGKRILTGKIDAFSGLKHNLSGKERETEE